MPRTIRFHLEEHVPHAVADGLRRLGIDVTTTTDAGLLGADDAAHLSFAWAEQRIIFPDDDDFLVPASQGMTHAALTYCRQNTRSIGYIVRALLLVWEVYEPSEMVGRIEFL